MDGALINISPRTQAQVHSLESRLTQAEAKSSGLEKWVMDTSVCFLSCLLAFLRLLFQCDVSILQLDLEASGVRKRRRENECSCGRLRQDCGGPDGGCLIAHMEAAVAPIRTRLVLFSVRVCVVGWEKKPSLFPKQCFFSVSPSHFDTTEDHKPAMGGTGPF